MDFSYRLDKSELLYGLSHLGLENLNGFIVEDLAIPSSSEVSVSNELTQNSQIPKYYFVISQSGNGILIKGDTSWTSNLLYFKNTGPDSITVSIFVLGDL